MDVTLLEKTELRVESVVTLGANLTELAATVAGVLGLPPDKVMVIDVRPDHVALDILVPTVSAEKLFGRKRALLDALGRVPGVVLGADADVHSAGILGAIALDEADAILALERSRAMGEAIAAARHPRIQVLPTGFELIERRIEDTNTPYLVKMFAEAGFIAAAGRPVADRRDDLSHALAAAAERCGLVVTTGGVGAEDKDFSVEAIEALDPKAATPYLIRFHKGEGRHLKDGVRIGVGVLDECLLVALPGPHDEVRLAAPVLLRGYKLGWDKDRLAMELAQVLRAKFTGAAGQPRHGHGEHGEHGHAHGGETGSRP